jgi:anti-sigma regulatory factor (Ser/Thr protein kinase)
MTGPRDVSAPSRARILRVPAEPGELSRIRRFVETQATELGADAGSVADVVQAVDESVTNIIKHGYRGQGGVVEVAVGTDGPALVVRLRDNAPSFDPTLVPTPDLDVPIERRRLGGMGVYLTRELTDEVRHDSPRGWSNELTLVKRVQPHATAER